MRATFSPLAVAFALARAFCSGGVRAMWVEVCSGCCALAAHVAAAAAGLLAALQTAFSWPTSSKAADRLTAVFPAPAFSPPLGSLFRVVAAAAPAAVAAAAGYPFPSGPPGHPFLLVHQATSGATLGTVCCVRCFFFPPPATAPRVTRWRLVFRHQKQPSSPVRRFFFYGYKVTTLPAHQSKKREENRRGLREVSPFFLPLT